MPWLRWSTIALALSEAGWMAFDGARALLVGDYLTHSTGARAGQLGPWAQLVAWIGIDPRSTPMKTIFVVYGVIWLKIIGGCALGKPWAWGAMLLAATASLWYLPIGTLTSVCLIVLLLWQTH